MPPRLSQPPHWEPFQFLVHRASSVPRAKQSVRFGPQDTHSGFSFSMPPRLSQPPQPEPFQFLVHRASSVPRTKQSIRFGPQDTHSSGSCVLPPRLSQPPHWASTASGKARTNNGKRQRLTYCTLAEACEHVASPRRQYLCDRFDSTDASAVRSDSEKRR